MFGPLGRDDQGARAKEEQIERDVAQVATLLGKVEGEGMKELAEKSGGSWEPLGTDEGEGQTQTTAGGPPA